MGETRSPKRPWLAVLLALAVTGLGHAYLRRWARAVGWLALVYATLVLFVPPEAMEAAASGISLGSSPPESVDPVTFLPSLAVALGSVLDAYLIARADRNAAIRENADENRTTCPNCDREVDAELNFCQWCTTEFSDPSVEGETDPNGRSD